MTRTAKPFKSRLFVRCEQALSCSELAEGPSATSVRCAGTESTGQCCCHPIIPSPLRQWRTNTNHQSALQFLLPFGVDGTALPVSSEMVREHTKASPCCPLTTTVPNRQDIAGRRR